MGILVNCYLFFLTARLALELFQSNEPIGLGMAMLSIAVDNG